MGNAFIDEGNVFFNRHIIAENEILKDETDVIETIIVIDFLPIDRNGPTSRMVHTSDEVKKSSLPTSRRSKNGNKSTFLDVKAHVTNRHVGLQGLFVIDFGDIIEFNHWIYHRSLPKASS